VRVLKAISEALSLSAETLLAPGGPDRRDGRHQHGREAARPGAGGPGTEDAIRADPRLSDDQKAALTAVYRSMPG
jgi:hypothetical protein